MVRVQVPRGGGPPRAHRAEDDPVRGGVREEGDEARGRPAAGGGGCQGRRRTRDSRGEAPEESDRDEAQADQAGGKRRSGCPSRKGARRTVARAGPVDPLLPEFLVEDRNRTQDNTAHAV